MPEAIRQELAMLQRQRATATASGDQDLLGRLDSVIGRLHQEAAVAAGIASVPVLQPPSHPPQEPPLPPAVQDELSQIQQRHDQALAAGQAEWSRQLDQQMTLLRQAHGAAPTPHADTSADASPASADDGAKPAAPSNTRQPPPSDIRTVHYDIRDDLRRFFQDVRDAVKSHQVQDLRSLPAAEPPAADAKRR